MGHFVNLLAILAALHLSNVCATGIAPFGVIPVELVRYFHPDELDEADHLGFVERQRRSSGIEEVSEDEPTYTLYSLGGAPCIMAKVDAIFNLEYRTLRHGTQNVKIDLPKEPEVSGSCVRDGDTAVLTMSWSVFNFSLVFTQNPEGNSYYLNTAILKYNQSLSMFTDTSYHGNVIARTEKGWNYYFTPLGKSWVCVKAADQGTLRLYNVDDEIIGNMTLYNIKVQPFVKRAKGKWGEELHCLERETQNMRENVVPYVMSLIYTAGVALCIAGYGIFRQFFVKKTMYGMYDENGEATGGGGGETFNGGTVPMEEFTPANLKSEDFAQFENQENYSEPQATADPSESTKPAVAPAANPFKKDTNITTNPFN